MRGERREGPPAAIRGLPRVAGGAVRIGGATYRHVACLKQDFFAESHLVRTPEDSRAVLKVHRLSWLPGIGRRVPLAAMCAHETRIHRLLSDVDGIPPLVGPAGRAFSLHRYVEGRSLQEIWDDILRGRPAPRDLFGPPFFERLARILDAVHVRGVAYLDLSKRENIIVDERGDPHLLDFQVSIAFRDPRSPILAWLAAEDRRQLAKHKRRLRPDLCTPAELALSASRSPVNLLHAVLLRRPWTALRALLGRRRVVGG